MARFLKMLRTLFGLAKEWEDALFLLFSLGAIWYGIRVADWAWLVVGICVLVLIIVDMIVDRPRPGRND